MNEYKQYNRIVNLIVKEVLRELSNDEQQELLSWLDEDVDNRNLYNRIKNSSSFSSWVERYKKIDVGLGWERLSMAIKKEKQHYLFNKILKYAAAILLPIFIGGGIIYFLSLPHQKTEISGQAAEIKPGTTKAVLVLSDGKTVVLDSLRKIHIKEENGALIEKIAGNLDYSQNNAQKKKNELIYNSINIPQGGEYSLVLSDGTQVYLNSMSKFKYPVQFVGPTREVELNGEAYFIVAKNLHKPFIVRTSNMNVEVLGTSFNVNAYQETGKVMTTLVEGKVKIRADKNSEGKILEPDEQAVYCIKSGTVDVKKVDVSVYTEWRNGQLIFYDERLEDIMTTLTRWYSAYVFYLNPSVKDLKFSGNLNRYGDIRQILDIIQSTNKLNVEIKNNTIVFSEKN